MDYNVTGGVGQFTVGWFVASAPFQKLTLQGGQQYLNALQLRDFGDPGYWTGLAGSTLDASSASFSTNAPDAALAVAGLAAVTAGGGHALFADAYYYGGTATPVLETNLTVAVGGVESERLFVNNTAVDYTFASADTNGIKGLSALYKGGVGRLTLAGNNTYTGTTAVLGGTLRVGDGGTAGSLNSASAITLGAGATLTFDRTDSYDGNVANVISGEGALVVNGGSLTLSGPNTYTGSTTVNAGTLTVPIDRVTPDITAWGQLTINSNATFASSAAAPFGYPSQSQAGVDRLISFFVNNGTLSYLPGALHAGLQFKSLRMAGGLAAINGQWIMYGDLSADDGTMSLIQSSGQPYVRIILRKPSTDTLFTVGSNATLTVGVALYADKDYIGSATLGFCKQGAGTLLLTAANPYAGSTTISEGTLKIGDGGTAGTLGQGAVTNNASLVFNRTDNYGGDIGNLISGTGSLTVASGTLALAGANTYSGATLVSNGVLRLTQTQCLATNTAVAIASGGMIDLAFTGVTTVRSLTINGVLQTRNRLFSRANRPAALSGDGFFLATEGAAPKGTLITIF